MSHKPRGQEREHRLGDGGVKPVARRRRIPERQTHSTPSRDADMAGDVKKGFIHGERGGEHRRQRHDGRRHGAASAGPEQSRRASRRTAART